ncbi:hypothetical protein phiA019_0012 [Aeromonas phage phiA019]|nr:hypothetical protein phiA009_0016 [Aeromonas phage phiA009]ULG01549.1 hypothetical protein phiA019_0012 [Aeromonas phage phiA019]
MENNNIYYKLICIDETHAIIAEQQLNNAETNKLKSKRLGRAVVVCMVNNNLEQNELAEINHLLSSVRVHAMAYDDDELSQHDINEIDKV